MKIKDIIEIVGDSGDHKNVVYFKTAIENENDCKIFVVYACYYIDKNEDNKKTTVCFNRVLFSEVDPTAGLYISRELTESKIWGTLIALRYDRCFQWDGYEYEIITYDEYTKYRMMIECGESVFDKPKDRK